MTTFKATVIADSIGDSAPRLTTLQLRYPRWIHSEFMTHRVFSRNASSSRAVPVSRLIADIQADPAFPIVWRKNQPGMQGYGEMSKSNIERSMFIFNHSLADAIASAQSLIDAGAHKQIINRLLEPFSHINVIVTSTDWANFFKLRRHSAAEPHMQILADTIWEALQNSTPVLLPYKGWHLPYISQQEQETYYQSECIKMSAARCARVSYLTHDGKHPSYDQDIKLYHQLVDSDPMHASAVEHQARPDTAYHSLGHWNWNNPGLHGNLRGWIQYRKTLVGECASEIVEIKDEFLNG